MTTDLGRPRDPRIDSAVLQSTVELLGETDDETNPLEGYKQRFVRPWPGPAAPDDRDDVFPEGFRRTAVEAAEGGARPERLVAAVDVIMRGN